jgi:predicted house-cleaning NTP pyrophosphatase (Maf/HAM1 superfamily)
MTMDMFDSVSSDESSHAISPHPVAVQPVPVEYPHDARPRMLQQRAEETGDPSAPEPLNMSLEQRTQRPAATSRQTTGRQQPQAVNAAPLPAQHAAPLHAAGLRRIITPAEQIRERDQRILALEAELVAARSQLSDASDESAKLMAELAAMHSQHHIVQTLKDQVVQVEESTRQTQADWFDKERKLQVLCSSA